jgi:Fur family ferric uptake transcriptional regulator
MTRSNGYQTKNRQRILSFLKENREKTVSAADIYEELERQGVSVNITTVYRYLERLLKEKKVKKYITDSGSKSSYQYVEDGEHCEEHLHLQCVECGQVIHLDCTFMDEIAQHLYSHHQFTLDCGASVLYGKCKKCSGKS